MANPSPQHTPTDGLGVAAVVLLSSNTSGNSALTKVGSQVAQSPGYTTGGHQYAITLSISGAGGYASSATLTPQQVDVKGNDYTSVESEVYLSYNYPNANSPSWYRPSNGSSGGTTGNTTYNPNVANVSSSGVITPYNVGTAIIEVSFPVYDNTLGDMNNFPSGNTNGFPLPVMAIFSQVIVTVIP